VADCSFLHKSSHRFDRLLNGHCRIDTLLVVQIDAVRSQPLKALLASLCDVFRPTSDLEIAVSVLDAKFSREKDLISSSGLVKPFADDFFVV
jgi:hypothetical protein